MFKQIIKSNANQYLSKNQTYNQSEKIIKQYELRIKDKDTIISNQIEMIKQLKELLDKKQ